jgi:hypothetical protein
MYILKDYINYMIDIHMHEKIFVANKALNVLIKKIKIQYKLKKLAKNNMLFFSNFLILHKLFDSRNIHTATH